jgi:hypothetical protein
VHQVVEPNRRSDAVDLRLRVDGIEDLGRDLVAAGTGARRGGVK